MDRTMNTKRGRSKKTVSSRNMVYNCQVHYCKYSGRRDNLKTHYYKAWFNENGFALSPSDPKFVDNQTCIKTQLYVLHTTYFFTHGIRRSDIENKFDTRLYCAPVAKCLDANQHDLSYYTSVPPTTNKTVTNCNADVLVQTNTLPVYARVKETVPVCSLTVLPTASINNVTICNADILEKRNTLPGVKEPVPVCSLTDLPRSNSPMASSSLRSTNLDHHSLSVDNFTWV